VIGVGEAFSPRYAQARQKFLQGCASAGLAVQSHVHPRKGRDGEELAMDIALDGEAKAEKLLIVSSACHGVEGHCGSGVQVFALHDAEWREKARDQSVAVLYVHALNPYGFSYSRRVTHENVDLNRNFLDFSQPRPVNEAYASLHPLLLPEEWPPTPANQAEIDRLIEREGLVFYQAAVTRGQYQFADGLFYGGDAPTWSNRTLPHGTRPQRHRRAHLRRQGRQGRLCARQCLVGHCGGAGDFDVRRLVHLGLPDRLDVLFARRRMPAGRAHLDRARVRNLVHARSDAGPAGRSLAPQASGGAG
jgi:hypothetical protein